MVFRVSRVSLFEWHPNLGYTSTYPDFSAIADMISPSPFHISTRMQASQFQYSAPPFLDRLIYFIGALLRSTNTFGEVNYNYFLKPVRDNDECSNANAKALGAERS